MTTYLPTIKQLQYLVAMHEHGHFGRAAESCFVPQSALSGGIRELESLLGGTLVEGKPGFGDEGGKLKMTRIDEGEALREDAAE